MRGRWIALGTLIIIAVAVGYFASPYLAARNFRDAVISADADDLEAAVDFPAVRENLKSQLTVVLMRSMADDPQMKNNPFAGLGVMMAPAVIDKALEAYVTPDGLSDLLSGQKPVTGVANKKGVDDIDFSYSWVSLDRFRVKTLNRRTNQVGPSLLFERKGFFSWKLIRFELSDWMKKENVNSASASTNQSSPPIDMPSTVSKSSLSIVVDPSASSEDLKDQWGALNEECRGGPHSPEDEICKARDAAESLLQSRGLCWPYSDQNVAPPDYRWHPCEESRPQ